MPHYRENTPSGSRAVKHPSGKPQRQNTPRGVKHVKAKKKKTSYKPRKK